MLTFLPASACPYFSTSPLSTCPRFLGKCVFHLGIAKHVCPRGYARRAGPGVGHSFRGKCNNSDFYSTSILVLPHLCGFQPAAWNIRFLKTNTLFSPQICRPFVGSPQNPPHMGAIIRTSFVPRKRILPVAASAQPPLCCSHSSLCRIIPIILSIINH
jgi:hypothetical protein